MKLAYSGKTGASAPIARFRRQEALTGNRVRAEHSGVDREKSDARSRLGTR
jgi:hypothetical protein